MVIASNIIASYLATCQVKLKNWLSRPGLSLSTTTPDPPGPPVPPGALSPKRVSTEVRASRALDGPPGAGAPAIGPTGAAHGADAAAGAGGLGTSHAVRGEDGTMTIRFEAYDVCIYMYVCMYVCIYVCMHACMDVCMYVSMYVCM